MKETINDRGRQGLALRLEPETRRKIEQWYAHDNCRSMNAFVEKAVNFYVGYLTVKDGNSFLPRSIQSAINGQLGMFKSDVIALLFKQSVELDMLNHLLADQFQLDEEYVARLRDDAMQNVKQINGAASLEQLVRRRDADEAF